MSWFKSFKKKLSQVVVGTAAGEWAVTAMACMVFADGEAEDEEIEKAKQVVKANPVIKNSIGEEKGAKLFNDAVEAIKIEPTSMLASYMQKCQDLASKVKKMEDKNFAIGTVIAIAAADGEVEPSEREMLIKFKAMLGATVDIP